MRTIKVELTLTQRAPDQPSYQSTTIGSTTVTIPVAIGATKIADVFIANLHSLLTTADVTYPDADPVDAVTTVAGS